MRYTILFSIFLLIVLTGCEKNKFSTTPSLKFKSVSSNELRRQETIRFTLSFTDAEGDLTDSIFIQQVVPGCPASDFHYGSYPLPAFPTASNQEGDIVLNLTYNDFSPQCPPKNDTSTFRFALKDKAQHSSDTVSSPIVIVYN